MKGHEKDGLLALFTHGLKKNQYRTFSNSKILITVFHDNGMLITGSTAFKLPNPLFIMPSFARETNISPPVYQLSLDVVKKLTEIPKEDLMKLANALDKSTSK
jgi:hypothetical protein